jgi:hypothetical protein
VRQIGTSVRATAIDNPNSSATAAHSGFGDSRRSRRAVTRGPPHGVQPVGVAGVILAVLAEWANVSPAPSAHVRIAGRDSLSPRPSTPGWAARDRGSPRPALGGCPGGHADERFRMRVLGHCVAIEAGVRTDTPRRSGGRGPRVRGRVKSDIASRTPAGLAVALAVGVTRGDPRDSGRYCVQGRAQVDRETGVGCGGVDQLSGAFVGLVVAAVRRRRYARPLTPHEPSASETSAPDR